MEKVFSWNIGYLKMGKDQTLYTCSTFIHHSSFTIHHSSFTIHHSPFTIHHSSFTIMHRILEPELMLDDEQARIYAEADFEEPHAMFIELFQKYFPNVQVKDHVIDLGCGPADISRRFAQTFEQCFIDGIDGSKAMLKYGQHIVEKYHLTNRVRLIQGYLPEASLPLPHYDAVISNSLLHHLPEPLVLWNTIKTVAKPFAPIFIMDLMRPESLSQAEILVKQYAQNEPEILQHDFYHSLLSAFRIDEVEAQLQAANLAHFTVHEVSDRHFIVTGRLSQNKY
jgi:ubiquinone/menaquinone biosynthesis C-methylase UbiE